MTCYYSKATASHAEEAFGLLADLFLHASFPEEEAVREKEVICEEISMNEDTPEDLCLDVLSRAVYGETGYGRNILGPAENVRSFTKAAVDEYKARLYRPENIVVSFAGAVSFEKAKELTEKYFGGMEGGRFRPQDKPVLSLRRSLFKNKPIEQVHLALAYPGISRADKRVEALQIMNTVIGSGMSSRLFQEVREKLALAYSVYSYPSFYRECGHLTIYAGVNPRNAQKAYEAVCGVLSRALKEGITQAEFSRAREQIRSSGIFSQESTSSQMLWYGRNLLHDDRIDSFEAQQARYDAVTLDDVMQVLSETFGGEKRGAAIVGDVQAPLAL